MCPSFQLRVRKGMLPKFQELPSSVECPLPLSSLPTKLSPTFPSCAPLLPLIAEQIWQKGISNSFQTYFTKNFSYIPLFQEHYHDVKKLLKNSKRQILQLKSIPTLQKKQVLPWLHIDVNLIDASAFSLLLRDQVPSPSVLLFPLSE